MINIHDTDAYYIGRVIKSIDSCVSYFLYGFKVTWFDTCIKVAWLNGFIFFLAMKICNSFYNDNIFLHVIMCEYFYI